MAGILVGDPACEFREIVKVFDNPSISNLKMEWSLMATRLNVDRVMITKKNQSPDECIYDVLVVWRSQNAEKSTLGNFLKDLPPNWNQLKKYVRDIMWDKAKTWQDLDVVLQEGVLTSKIRFLGLESTLASLEVTLTGTTLKEDLPQKPFKDVLKCDEFQFPIPLPYYIDRKLTIKQKLRPEIFMEKCNDIFVFEDIEPYQLSALKKAEQNSGLQELTDDTFSQLEKLKFSVRFMRLKYQNDFKGIVRKTSHPVHRIKYNAVDQTYHWICTVGSIHLITKFLSDSFEEISEADLITRTLKVFNSRPVAICSSPGMGKSFLSKNLANQMNFFFPERFVIYLAFKKLMERLSTAQSQLSIDVVIEILASEATPYGLGRIILKQKMHDENSQFEIFLDGFDEIPPGSLELAKHILKVLLNSTNMRCHITSRPHMSTELEDTAGVVSYNIAPFNTNDQINFFCDYWTGELKIGNRDLLSKFASLLLESPTLLNSNENVYGEIAGIPLQCVMLAQLYSEKVEKFCEDPTNDSELIKSTLTLMHLYEKFMEYKFQQISDSGEKELVKKFHWLSALDVLFPESPDALIIRHDLENELGKTHLSTEVIFRVGILEAKENFDSPEFVHRTFAEFLLAEFIVEEFLKKKTDLICTWTTFVYKTILETQYITSRSIESDLHDSLVSIIELSNFWKDKQISETYLKILRTVQRSHQSPMGPHIHELNLLGDSKQMRLRCSRWVIQKRSENLYTMVEHIDDLVSALYRLERLQLADELERANAYGSRKIKFLHATVSFFLDAILMECQSTIFPQQTAQFPVHRGLFSQLNGSSKTLILKLLTCTDGCFENLTRLVLMLSCETPSIFENLQIDYKGCQEIVFCAANQNNVEFFEYCCKNVNLLASFPYKDAKYTRKIKTRNTDFNMEYVHTPLHVAVQNGHYSITEHLVKQKELDWSTMHGLWQLCLHDSYKDMEHVVQKKEEILEYLKSNNMIINLNEISSQEFPNKVHCKLFTNFCDVLGYTPCEKDIDTICSHVIKFCDDSGFQIEQFFSWLYTKNLKHFINQRTNASSSLLSVALEYNKINPETFRKILSWVHFDPNDTLWAATRGKHCEDMVKAIVEITGRTDHVDMYHQTLLYLAVGEGNLNAVKYLISNGAKVCTSDCFGETPLHLALDTYYPDQDIVKLLLQISSEDDVKTKNAEGKTPFSLFMEDRGMWEWDECVVELFKHKYFATK